MRSVRSVLGPLALSAFALSAFAPSAFSQTCLNTINPYLANNNGSVGGAVYFDVAVTSAVLIQSIQSNCNAVLGTPCGIDVYTTPGTSVGNQGNIGVWTLVGTDNGTTTSTGRNAVTTFTLVTPIQLVTGNYGMAIVARGTAHAYTNGTGANQNFSDAFLALTLGSALNVPFSGTAFTPRVWNGALCYVPAAGIFPNFTATPRSGNIPLNVNFTDTTYTSDPLGVQSWSWDLDGDNIADSSAPNPSFTYSIEGFYNVTLQVTDTIHPTATLTRNAYIGVDIVDASFTTTALGATNLQFNDTSIGNPTSWQWDFQNDGIVDSALQNPTFNYPSPGSYTVRLAVADAISNDTTTVNIGVSILPIPAFGRTFPGATTRGYYFQTPVRFSIVSAKVPDETNNGFQNVAIYRLTGAAPAFPGTASGGLEFFSAGQPSAAPLPCSISFDAGEWVGVLGACGNATTLQNSYGTPVGPFASSIFGNPVTLIRMLTQTNIVTTGGTAAYSSEAAFEISRVELGISSATGLAYGAGTPSGAGPAAPVLATTSVPRIGTLSELTVTQQDPTAFGFLLLSLGRGNLPLPFGTLLIDIFTYQFALQMNAGNPMNVGATTYSLAIPNDPVLNGGSVTWQNLNLVPGSPNQLSLSNGQEWFAGF